MSGINFQHINSTKKKAEKKQAKERWIYIWKIQEQNGKDRIEVLKEI